MAGSFDQLLAGPISCSATTLSPVIDIAVCLYAVSNITLHFVGESRFHELKFNISLIALDTVVLIASLIINGRPETNLYHAYFLLIIVCSIFENSRLIAIISLAAPFESFMAIFRNSFDPNGF
jgi:hypothetical protein